MKRIFIVLFTAIVFPLHSQIKIVDAQTGSGIHNVHVFVSNAKLGSVTDIDGMLQLSEIEKQMDINGDNQITIQHIAYNNVQIDFDELKNKSVLELTERHFLLDEIIIIPNKEYDYILLKGYFRSYQFDDSIPKFYYDGIVEYYIPYKGNALKNRVIQHRCFRNQTLIDAQTMRAATMYMEPASVPYIGTKTIRTDLSKEYSLKELENKTEIYKKNTLVGSISTPTNTNVIMSIDKIKPDKEKNHKLFGYISRIQGIDIVENYISNDWQNIEKSDLESYKSHRKIYFSHKKDTHETEVIAIHEFYVIEKSFISKDELKKIDVTGSTSMKKSHYYIDEYWTKLEEYNIPELSVQVKDELGKSLLIFEETNR